MKNYENINWNDERKLFPATSNSTYLASAAVGPLSKAVYETQIALSTELYRYGELDLLNRLDEVEETRVLSSNYFDGGGACDIGFAPNTSHVMNLLAMMLKDKNSNIKKGEVIACVDEFPSSTLPWIHHGFDVKLVERDDIITSINTNTVAVIVSAVQFSSGYRQNLIELGDRLDKLNIPFIVNATQAIGAYKISVKESKISALCASCHKWLCAGYGTSIFYTSKQFRKDAKLPLAGWLSVKDPMLMDNSNIDYSDEMRAIETGVTPWATIFSIKAALMNCKRIGIDNISRRIQELSNYLVKRLIEIGKGDLVVNNRDNEADFKKSINSGIVLLKLKNCDELVKNLEKEKIIVNARWGKIRVAIHYFNDKDDIERLIKYI